MCSPQIVCCRGSSLPAAPHWLRQVHGARVVQVGVAGAGPAPHEADAFIARVRRDYGFAIEGLMCIPPADEPAGPHFALLAKIAARNGVAKLSMGMSADYEIAVMFGATSVRVGSALFGARATTP